jgi:SAM-dependent methyltransferase
VAVDAHFAEPRLVALYDVLEGVRDDLDVYLAIAEEVGARTVVDVGCGTGTLACLLAAQGLEVVGVDPAAASLELARRKPQANRVRWVLGGAADVPPLRADLATMTGNVAQVFTTDEEWAAALGAVHAALRPGGSFVFETRRPERQAWREWTPERTRTRIGSVETWQEVTDVRDGLVSFRTTFVLADDVLTSDSTLRFRTRAELDASLTAAGFVVDDVRDAPDRPGRELVVLARRPSYRHRGTRGLTSAQPGPTPAQAAARSSSNVRSRSLRVSEAACSNSARASGSRPSCSSRSPRTLGSRW